MYSKPKLPWKYCDISNNLYVSNWEGLSCSLEINIDDCVVNDNNCRFVSRIKFDSVSDAEEFIINQVKERKIREASRIARTFGFYVRKLLYC